MVPAGADWGSREEAADMVLLVEGSDLAAVEEQWKSRKSSRSERVVDLALAAVQEQ